MRQLLTDEIRDVLGDANTRHDEDNTRGRANLQHNVILNKNALAKQKLAPCSEMGYKSI